MTSYYNTNTKILRDEKEDHISRVKIDRWIFALLILAVSLVPILIGGYAKMITGPRITNIELMASGLKGDLFTHYKAIALMVITLAASGLLLAKVFFMEGEIRKTKLNIFIGIFAVAIILSTILSPSVSIALWGQYNRSDGAISYLCYLALFFVAMNIDYPKKALEYVMYSLYPFVAVNFVLMMMNFYGHDAMTYPVVQKMMGLFLPEGASLSEGSTILGTLNQWNYMSGMFAVMTVMYLAWAIVDKNTIRSFVNVAVSVVSLAIMLMSVSTSGFLTVLLITPLLVWLAVKSTNRKRSIVALCAFVIISLPVFHVLANKDSRVWDESIGFIIKKNPYVKEQPVGMGLSNMEFQFGSRVYAAENSFELPELPEANYSAGSGRVYIWGKAIDLVMERPLIGFGLDTFMYHFPHYNIDARAGMWLENTIVDKPHNMYVGILYGTGIIGFIGFAGLAIIMALGALKAIVTRQSIIPAVLSIGWLAFLIQALFNDALPGTAAPMWVIAGMLMAFIGINKEFEEITYGRND